MPTFTALLKNKELQVQYTDSDNVMIALYDEVDWALVAEVESAAHVSVKLLMVKSFLMNLILTKKIH